MGGDRRTQRRGIALGIALAVHVAVLWLALYIEGFERLRGIAEPEPVMTMSISIPQVTPPPPPPETPARPRRERRPQVVTPVEPVVPTSETPSTAITVPNLPPIDWNRESEITARSMTTPDEGPKEKPLDGDVKGMKLPNATRTPRVGDSSIRPDGTIVVLTAVSGDTGVYCESGPPLLMDHFETWSRFVPVTCGARSIRKRKPFTLEKPGEDDAQSALP